MLVLSYAGTNLCQTTVYRWCLHAIQHNNFIAQNEPLFSAKTIIAHLNSVPELGDVTDEVPDLTAGMRLHRAAFAVVPERVVDVEGGHLSHWQLAQQPGRNRAGRGLGAADRDDPAARG